MKRDSFNAFLIALLVGFVAIASYLIFSSKGEKKGHEPEVVYDPGTEIVQNTNRVVRDDVQTVGRVIRSESNGPVMVTVDLSGLKNAVEVK